MCALRRITGFERGAALPQISRITFPISSTPSTASAKVSWAKRYSTTRASRRGNADAYHLGCLKCEETPPRHCEERKRRRNPSSFSARIARLMRSSPHLRDASCLLNALIRARIAKPRRVAWLCQRSRPIRKTVLAAPPPVHRLPAPFASEAADLNARLPFLRSVVNRLARQATEKDAQWSLVHH